MGPGDLARLVLLGSIWGSSFLLIKLGLEDLTPIQIVAVRVVIGAIVLAAFARLRGLSLPRRELWRHLAVMAVASNLIPFTLIGWGEERITSGMAAILNSTVPLFTIVLASIFLAEERATPARSLGVMVGFTGVAVLVGLDATGDLVGELAVVLASLSYAVGLVYVRSKVSGRAAPLSMSLIQLIIATLLVVPAAAVDVTIAPPSWGWESALAVTALGAFGTGIAYVLFFRLIQDVGATSASFVTYLIPIFGVFLGVVFLDESLGWNALLGATLVIAGIALAERARRVEGAVRKEPSDAEKVAEAAAGSVTE